MTPAVTRADPLPLQSALATRCRIINYLNHLLPDGVFTAIQPENLYAKLLYYTYYKISSPVSAHTLLLEKGRYHNIERGKRICQMCDMNDVEDEYHFILKCPFYTHLRHLYINKYYWSKPSVFKLVQLLSVQNRKVLCNIGNYLKHVLYIYVLNICNCPPSIFVPLVTIFMF